MKNHVQNFGQWRLYEQANESTNNAIAQAAKDSIGESTVIKGLPKGNPVIGVAMIFKKATGNEIIPDTPLNKSLGTSALWNELSGSQSWEKITDWRNNYQPGDVILTVRKLGGRSGHAGIVVEDGEIVSNSSSGGASNSPGTIQKNYKIDIWSYTVAKRNPEQTAIFRYIG